MIVTFSAGPAAVLMGVGLALVTIRSILQKIRPAGDGFLISRLPVASAAVVVLPGVVMTVARVMSVATARVWVPKFIQSYGLGICFTP